MNKWLKIVQQLWDHWLPLPCYCVLCLRSIKQIALCKDCEERLPWLTSSGATTIKEKNTPFDQLLALFNYAWPVSEFIAQLKYKKKLYFANILGNLMATRCQSMTPIDCIVPIPLHPIRQRQRGFNQTLEIAKIIAKQKRLQLDKWSCIKVVNTITQSQLRRKAREKNIREHDFFIKPSFCAKHVLVIEDVVTTGSTIHAFALALKKAGVQTVEIWSLCRTQPLSSPLQSPNLRQSSVLKYPILF